MSSEVSEVSLMLRMAIALLVIFPTFMAGVVPAGSAGLEQKANLAIQPILLVERGGSDADVSVLSERVEAAFALPWAGISPVVLPAVRVRVAPYKRGDGPVGVGYERLWRLVEASTRSLGGPGIVRFVVTADHDWNIGGGWEAEGRRTGLAVVGRDFAGPGWERKTAVALHELGHAAGLDHDRPGETPTFMSPHVHERYMLPAQWGAMNKAFGMQWRLYRS
jgi:hypothetical protein